MLSPRVFGLILRVLVDRSQSEEVLQEVFLEIWQSADRFAPNKGQGRSWVLTIAHRRAVDRVRSAQASTNRDVRAGFRDLGVAYDGVAEEVELRIEGQRVTEALATLPDPQREAITLAYYGVTVRAKSRRSWERRSERSRRGCGTACPAFGWRWG